MVFLLVVSHPSDRLLQILQFKIETKIGTIDEERRTGGTRGRKTAAMTERGRKSKVGSSFQPEHLL